MLISGSWLRPARDGDALLRGGAPDFRDLFRAPEPPRIAARDEAHTAETPRGQADRACGPALHPSPPPLPASSLEPQRHPPSASSHPAGTIPKTPRRHRKWVLAAPGPQAIRLASASTGPGRARALARPGMTGPAAIHSTVPRAAGYGVRATPGSAPRRRAPLRSGHWARSRRARRDNGPHAVPPAAVR